MYSVQCFIGMDTGKKVKTKNKKTIKMLQLLNLLEVADKGIQALLGKVTVMLKRM